MARRCRARSPSSLASRALQVATGPSSEIRSCLIGALQEFEEKIIRRRGLPDRLVRQQKLAKARIVRSGGRGGWSLCEPVRLRVGIGVEDWIGYARCAGPEAGAADLVRISLARYFV